MPKNMPLLVDIYGSEQPSTKTRNSRVFVKHLPGVFTERYELENVTRRSAVQHEVVGPILSRDGCISMGTACKNARVYTY